MGQVHKIRPIIDVIGFSDHCVMGQVHRTRPAIGIFENTFKNNTFTVHLFNRESPQGFFQSIQVQAQIKAFSKRKKERKRHFYL
jgi:hypothetical protein